MKKLINGANSFLKGMGDRKLMIYAASGCYYMFMSLVPTVMILCCILPYTPFSEEMILAYIDEYFAESLGVIIARIVAAVYASNAATLTISILLTLYSASASMKALIKGMNAAYDIDHTENFIKLTVRALIDMIILVAALLISLVIMVYGGKILEIIVGYVSRFELHIPLVSSLLEPLLSRARYLAIMVVLALVFTLLYTLMPTEKIRPEKQIPGAIFSAVIWVIFSSLFTLYVNVSDKYGAYGFIGTIMVAMLWIYYCLFFLLIGGYINSLLTVRRERKLAENAAVNAELPEADFQSDEIVKKDE